MASNAVTPSTNVPGAPTSVVATAGNASASVSWTAPGSTVTNYVVTPYIGALPQPATTVGNVVSTTISGLTHNTTYTFKVAATNASGTSPESAPSNAVTPLAVAPSAPTSVVATAGNASAKPSAGRQARNGGSAITNYVVTPYFGPSLNRRRRST